MSGRTLSALRQATIRNSACPFQTGIPSKTEAQKLCPAHCYSINKFEVTSKSLFYCKFRLLNKIAIHHVANLTTAGCQCWQRFACLLYSAPSKAASQRSSSSSGRFQTAVSCKLKASLADLPGGCVTRQKLVPDVRGLFCQDLDQLLDTPLSGCWNLRVRPLLPFCIFAAGMVTLDLNLPFVRKFCSTSLGPGPKENRRKATCACGGR